MSAEPGAAGRIKRQRALPWNTAAEITMMGLRVRLERSLITAASVALACAFLAFTLGGRRILDALLALSDPDVNFLLQRNGIDLEERGAGLSARERWLIATSMVVAFAGVTNALLMSVTERIKEIGTMKCLGALDTFVVKLFLIEALLIGTISALAGALGGLGARVATDAVQYGRAVLAAAPWGSLAIEGIRTVAAGALLSVLGSIYPALMAARMQPVEAMRTEV
jgi:putative ABC transport system permease protein